VARPRNQDERRRQLVEATALAISDRGLSGLRLKHIADRAGLSIGSVLYYYPDLDALLVEVHQRALEQFYFERVRATQAVDDPAAQLRVAVDHGVPEDADDVTLRVIYELHVASSREPSHAALLTALWEREVSLYEGILVRGAAAGILDLKASSHAIAQTVVALEDAFDLHLAGHNHAIDRQVAVDRILDYLTAMTGLDLGGPIPSRPAAVAPGRATTGRRRP
jgi:AcrR family transcriptional regulator